MKLLIVESPAKAKTISKYLDDKYKVVASVGHIRDLPKSNKKAIDIEAGFVPYYEIVPGKEHIVDDIKKLAKKADEILLATDPDREGEAIAWHIAQATGLKSPQRVVFHEITKEEVTKAVKNPRKIDMNLKEAQEARRVLDRLVGYDLSGLIWKKVRYGLSAGRVQSPALRIIMEREREIRAFKSEKYYVLTAKLKTEKGEEFEAISEKEPKEKAEVLEILKKANNEKWKVIDVTETKVARAPKAPFITSTLQQTASSRLGFAPSRTMQVAQKLYEQGFITYMRTDSTNLSEYAVSHIEEVVNKKFGKEYFEKRTYIKKVKNAQEAHEAIRPSDFSKESCGNNDEQKKLYRLIWARTVASQMRDAGTLRTKIIANVESESIPNFNANGSRIIEQGWLLADPMSKQDDVELPKTSAGEALNLLSINDEEKETTPPPRYSEAGLIKELEKRGIGRPSTYASIIKTIVDRRYVEKVDRSLVPTDTGDVVSSFLEQHFMNYISDSFTAEMEDKLDNIAEGKAEYKKTLTDFYKPFLKDVKANDKLDKITTLGDGPVGVNCPICNGKMIIKLGKTGKFLSCEKYPDCMGARKIDGTELEGPKDTGEKCPDCADGKLMERDGRFGRFVACSNYPKCKYIKKDALISQNSSGVKCNVCNEGEFVEKRGRFGIFWSCSNYPKCKNIIKSKPTGNICPICKSLMMEGTKTIPERCSNKTCPNHNPHKLGEEKDPIVEAKKTKKSKK